MRILRYKAQSRKRAKEHLRGGRRDAPYGASRSTPRTVKELASDELRTFYKKYYHQLFSFISSKIERREDAEEILQDTWISIMDSLALFNFRSSFLTWAKAIALHEVADFYRKRKIKSIVFSRLPFLENLASAALGPELALEKKEVRAEIEATLSSLSEGYRKILRLKYMEGFSMAEIARLLKISVKSVESKLFRARLAFQKQWQASYPLAFSDSLPFFASKKAI